MPTVWLQERLKLPQPPGWEVVLSTVYMSFFVLPYVVAAVLWLRNRDEWKAFVRLFVGLSFAGSGRSTRCCPPRRRGRRPGARPTTSPPARRARGACSAPAAECPTAVCSARCRPPRRRQRLGGAHRRAGLGQHAPAHGERADRPGAGQRQPGRGDPVAARGADGRGVGVPVAPGRPPVAAAAGRLSLAHGVHAGVHRRALRRRRAAGLGARRGRGGGVCTATRRDGGRASQPPAR